MGEIYRAVDTRLERSVAVKVLPSDLATDPAQVRRFVREAQAASALNHPNIVTIFEIYECALPERNTTAHCIAMELIEGETLRAWLRHRKPDLKKVVEIFAQVAQGLAKAHEAGIVHRDLKPDNVMMTKEGYPKILDFGVAKLLSPSPREGTSDAGETHGPLTATGAVIGTAGYMSPEQVEGQEVDPRSDVFSFGSMLFEAVAGRPPFAGRSAIDTLHRIVHTEAPHLRDLHPGAPAELERIVEKCLAKDPEDRYQSTKDLAVDLRHLWRQYETGMLPEKTDRPRPDPGAQVASRAPRARRRLGLLVGAAAVAAAAALIAVLVVSPRRGDRADGPAATPADPTALQIERLTYSGKASWPALSPDGKVVVHAVETAGRTSLWVRQVATSSSLQIVPPAQATILGITIAPDGNYAYFVERRGQDVVRRLFRVPILGGAPRKLLDDVDSPVTFSPAGQEMAFVRCSIVRSDCALMIARADGAGERRVATRPFSSQLSSPAWSPDGAHLALFARIPDQARQGIEVFAVDGGTSKRLGTQTWHSSRGLAWLPDGRGLIGSAMDRSNRQSQLWYISYPEGRARRVTNDPNNYLEVSLSRDGSALVTMQVDRVSNLWVVPEGDQARARQLTTGAGRYHSLAYTPDGRIVYSAIKDGAWDLWLMAVDGAEPTRLTSEAGANLEPAVSPDGQSLVFVSDRSGSFAIWRAGIDGTDPRQITPGSRDVLPVFTPDGRFVVYTSFRDEKQSLWKVPAGGGTAVPLTTSFTAYADVSPDGRRLVTSFWEGRLDAPLKIAVLPIEGGPPEQTTVLPATALPIVRWTPDAKGFSYVDSREGTSNIWVQPLAGPPRKVTEFASDEIFQHRWAPGGRQIALVRGLKTSDVMIVRGFR
jgi:Tol biopolymer transport system component